MINKEKEDERNQLNILKVLPNVEQNLEILGSHLTQLEKWLLKSIVEKRTPMNTRQIFNKIINDIYCVVLNGWDRENVDLLLPTEIPEIKGVFSENASFFRDQYLDNMKRKTTTEFINWASKELKGNKVSFPSYETVMDSLVSLEDLNIITRRPPNAGKREKFYWVLNPLFIKYFEKYFEKISKL